MKNLAALLFGCLCLLSPPHLARADERGILARGYCAEMEDMINVLEAVDPEPPVPFIRGAFEEADRILERSRALAEEGWRVVETWMRDHRTPRIVRPDGGILAWVLPEGWTAEPDAS